MNVLRLVSRSGQSTVRAVVLFAALAGLFAMHGLADHGATHQDQLVMTDSAMSHTAHASVHEDRSTAPHEESVGASAEVMVDAGDGRLPGTMGLMGLCLAVLALAGLLAANLLRTTSRRRGPTRTSYSQEWVRPSHLRTVDPPGRYRLQVHRC